MHHATNLPAPKTRIDNIFAPVSVKSDSGGAGPDKPDHSRLGRFIQTYSSFLSTFVIGVAGLAATSIWQYRQSLTAAEAARSEQAIARTKADNDWRIARAEILSKNLTVLSTQGPQRPTSASACCCH